MDFITSAHVEPESRGSQGKLCNLRIMQRGTKEPQIRAPGRWPSFEIQADRRVSADCSPASCFDGHSSAGISAT